ncbi:hypothetical protein [Salinibius halmophilus]|uniref:hypothetical protein n=1 Tax=Salinibius halmophilus TaxID=1853216 RepID=UPI000E670E16|nr:hypothetical protein [Salinibius halmophilus]
MKAAIAALASLPSVALACSLNVGFQEQHPFHFDVYHGEFYATTGGVDVDILRAVGGRGNCDIEIRNLEGQAPFDSPAQAFIAESDTFDYRHVVLYELPYQLVSIAPLTEPNEALTLGVLSSDDEFEWTNQFASTVTLEPDSWQQALKDDKVDAVLWHPFDAAIDYNSPLQRQVVEQLPLRGMSLFYADEVSESVRKTIADTLVIATDNVENALNRYQVK